MKKKSLTHKLLSLWIAAFAVPVCAAESTQVKLSAPEGGTLSFSAAGDGFGVAGLAYGKTVFAVPGSKAPGLWKLRFAAGTAGEMKELDAATCSGKRSVRRLSGTWLRFMWTGVDIDGGDAAIDVDCDVEWNAAGERFEFRIGVTNRSRKYGLFATDYPRFASVVEKGRGAVILPGWNWGARRLRELEESCTLGYPDYDVPIQFAAFEADTGDGAMITALDPDGRTKYFSYGKDNSFHITATSEHAGVPGNSCGMPFAVSVKAFRGNWWKAAKLYRAWAVENASWMKKGPLARRRDIPGRIRDAGLWMSIHTDDDKGFGQLHAECEINKMLKRLDGRLPLSLEWYGWHKWPQDKLNPEFFPARTNFGAAVRRLTEKGVLILPYMNGRIWDHGHSEFDQVKRYACHQRDGSLCTEDWSGRKFSAMCQSTPVWRDRVKGIIDRMVGEYGANGIYIDQVASMSIAECFSPDHGHPVGGGTHWVDDYKKMVREVRAGHPGVPLTSENFSEPYVDEIDAFELWCPNCAEDVPMIPAVYSGYAIFYGGCTSSSYTSEAFRAAEGRNFLWGMQTGYADAWILAEDQRAKLDYSIRLAELRSANMEYFIDGELLEEIPNRAKVDMLKVVWRIWGPKREVSLQPVMATRWRSPSGKELVAIANFSDKTHPFDGGEEKLKFTLAPGEVKLVK